MPGAGASGVAAGMLAPVGEATWGEDELLELALASHRLWPGFAEELREASGAGGFVGAGALHVALDPDEAAELRRRFELMQAHELDAAWLSPAECRKLEPGLTPRLAGGLHAPHEAMVAPAELVATLQVACEAAGVEIRSGAEVSGAILDYGRFAGVVTADGVRHQAETSVLAAGAWMGSFDWLPEAARPPVRPVKGQILTLRGRPGQVCGRIVVSERVYVVPRADGRLVVGATVEEMGFDTRVTAGAVHELLREAYRALPDIAELEFERAAAGLRPTTPDNLPVIGPAAIEGLILAGGHFRNGILLAPLTAEAVAAVLAGDDPRPELRAASPARFTERAEVAR